MVKVRLTGYRRGANTVALIKLVRERCRQGLALSHRQISDIGMTGAVPEYAFERVEDAREFLRLAIALGATATWDGDREPDGEDVS